MPIDPDNDNDDDTNDPNDTQDVPRGFVGLPLMLAHSSQTRGASHAKANRSNVSKASTGVKRHKKPS